MSKKWLVVSSHDERYDFNLELSIFEGTVEEFEENNLFFDRKDREENNDGSYVYHKSKRSNRECTGFLNDYWDKIKDYVELVDFHTICLIPIDNLNDSNFIFHNPIVCRNSKFGFLDVK